MSNDYRQNDDNGDALRSMESSGDDLSASRDIDFSVIFSNEGGARSFADRVGQDGHRTSLEEPEGIDANYEVTVTINMVPTHGGISAFEKYIEELAGPLHGWNDGWGCFAVKK